MCRAMEEMRNETEHAKAIKVAKGMLQLETKNIKNIYYR